MTPDKLGKIEGRFRPTEDGKCALSRGGMVATAFPDATAAGVEMLEQGGNAVDAACAAAFALSVCEPQASGLGGQSMAIMSVDGRMIGLDGSSRAPSLAHLSRIGDKDELFTGHRATTLPSTPAVLDHMNHRYGKLPIATVLEPAIRLAREGYRITELQSRLQAREIEAFMAVPGQTGARYFLRDGRTAYEPGDTFKQPELAAMLERLANAGVKDFYVGEVARQIDADMRANDGFLRADDLALVPWPVERPTIHRAYRNTMVHTLPPPSAGPALLLVLMMLNQLASRFVRKLTPQRFHFVAETFRKAFRARRRKPADPQRWHPRDKGSLMSRKVARELARTIRDGIDPELQLIEEQPDDPDTTHLSVMDKDGNAVGITQSIELVYGSKTAADGLGFLYNNYMTRFEREDASHPYYLRPNAIPWTTVAPAIVTLEKQPWMVLGSPGSERIFSTISQFLLHVIDGSKPIGEAMYAPRLHCSTGGKVSLEVDRFPQEIVAHLEQMGYTLDRREPFAFYLGALHAVLRCRSGDREGWFQGVAECRRDGVAAGPEPVAAEAGSAWPMTVDAPATGRSEGA